MNRNADFTFFGDLLGISADYRLSPRLAYDKLNEFYNTAFDCLSPYCGGNQQKVTVNCFSDSLLVWGNGAEVILKHLQTLYINLFQKGLLLRGAIVKGRLEKDPRLELANFRKFLPTDDTLARAVGLERTGKGARLLISPALAESLLAWISTEKNSPKISAVPLVPDWWSGARGGHSTTG